jgi:hypothetical protein
MLFSFQTEYGEGKGGCYPLAGEKANLLQPQKSVTTPGVAV